MIGRYDNKNASQDGIAWIVVATICVLGTGWDVAWRCLQQIGFHGHSTFLDNAKSVLPTLDIKSYVFTGFGAIIFAAGVLLFYKILKKHTISPNTCIMAALSIKVALYFEDVKIGLLPVSLAITLNIVLLSGFTVCLMRLISQSLKSWLGKREVSRNKCK
jgi:hypothetical protein